MSEDRKPARTKLDFLYQEVLGEVAGLIKRTEQISAQLAASSEQAAKAAKAIDGLPQRLQSAMETTGRRLNTEGVQATRDTLAATESQLRELAAQSANYARIAHASARKMALIALLVGGGAGIMGGLLAGLALGRFIAN